MGRLHPGVWIDASSLAVSSFASSAALLASAAPRCASAIRASAVFTRATASTDAALAEATCASAAFTRALESAICAWYCLAKALAWDASSRDCARLSEAGNHVWKRVGLLLDVLGRMEVWLAHHGRARLTPEDRAFLPPRFEKLHFQRADAEAK